jgi:hypothetical protein
MCTQYSVLQPVYMCTQYSVLQPVTDDTSLSFVYVPVTALHLGIIPINNQPDAQFLLYIFISILCMFRAWNFSVT